MVEARFITPEEREAAFRTKVRVNPVLANQRAQYFVDWIDDETVEVINKDLLAFFKA